MCFSVLPVLMLTEMSESIEKMKTHSFTRQSMCAEVNYIFSSKQLQLYTEQYLSTTK